MTEQSFRKIYADLAAGQPVAPRGQDVLELENYTYELPAYARFANFEARKLKLDYIKTELRWYLRANPRDLSIQQHAATWRGLENPDSSINSNYGAHLFGMKLNAVSYTSRAVELTDHSQFDSVVEELLRDKNSRRASMAILSRNHVRHLDTIKDLPCTYALNFRIRNNELRMSVHMRSQDAIFGMGNDAPFFSMVQEMVYVSLRDLGYPELKMGSYHHIADSFHVYKRHFNMLNEINAGSPFTDIQMPKISGVAEVRHLVTTFYQHCPPNESSAHINAHEINNTMAGIDTFFKRLGQSRSGSAHGDFSTWLLT
jgi:thymidylate synthase